MRSLGTYVAGGGRQLFVANYQTDARADHGTHGKSFRVFRGTTWPLAEVATGPAMPQHCSFAVGIFNTQRSTSNSQGPKLAFRRWMLSVECSPLPAGQWGKHLPLFRCSPQYPFPMGRVIMEK